MFLLSEAEWALFFPEGVELPNIEVFTHREDNRADVLRLLRNVDPEVVVTSWSSPQLTEEVLKELPSLRYVCHTSGSVRNLVPRSFLEQGNLVTNWGTLAADNVAEQALLLMLSALRRSPEWPPVIAGKLKWQPSPILTQTLFRKRVGIHGFGNVARSLVALMRPFSVSVSAFSHGVPDADFDKHGVERCDSLEELFSRSDIVVECEALNPLTSGSVSREVLECLPPGGLFVNVGRGAVVDERAMAELAYAGRLRVALDVYEHDPIAPDSLLHEVEGAVLSPHIAGPTSDQFSRCGVLAQRNIEAFFSGEPLTARVTLDIYDRAT